MPGINIDNWTLFKNLDGRGGWNWRLLLRVRISGITIKVSIEEPYYSVDQ